MHEMTSPMANTHMVVRSKERGLAWHNPFDRGTCQHVLPNDQQALPTFMWRMTLQARKGTFGAGSLARTYWMSPCLLSAAAQRLRSRDRPALLLLGCYDFEPFNNYLASSPRKINLRC